LRVPVPFVMARRTAASARFVTVYEPYRESPAVMSVVERSPGVFEVALDGARDEVSVVAGKWAYRRVEEKR